MVAGHAASLLTGAAAYVNCCRANYLLSSADSGDGVKLLAPFKWNLGAVSTAEWTGVPLVEVLDRVGIRPEAREVLFRGADCGTVPGQAGTIHFERSLSLDDARSSEALLAYAMNGEPLRFSTGTLCALSCPAGTRSRRSSG